MSGNSKVDKIKNSVSTFFENERNDKVFTVVMLGISILIILLGQSKQGNFIHYYGGIVMFALVLIHLWSGLLGRWVEHE